MRKIIVIWMATTILAGIFLTAFPGNAEAKMCSHCDGTGECPTCGGDGSVWLEPCEACEGSGDCQKCGGDGEVFSDTTPGFEAVFVVGAITAAMILYRRRVRCG